MQQLITYVGNAVVEAVFPPKCDCGKWGKNICKDCLFKAIIYKTPLCPICGKISPQSKTCINCKNKSKLTGVMILGKHDGVLKKSIWRLKYGFNKTISKDLASMLVDKFGEGISKKRPVVTWVPETKKKLRSRGYNQSKEIAQHFADKLLLCSGRLLAKNTETKSQVGLKKRERLMNVTGSFDYVGPKEINNNIVLIIDDVYTTGATLEECAKVLRRAGYREIWAMVLTRD